MGFHLWSKSKLFLGFFAFGVFALQTAHSVVGAAAYASGVNTGLTVNGEVVDNFWFYANLASTDGAGSSYETWTDPQGHTGMKFMQTGMVNYSTAGACYEVYTNAQSGSLLGTDTRIYAGSAFSTYASASDDRGSSDRTSRLRAWIGTSTGGISLRVQGYSEYYNNIDFALTINRIPGKTESNCQLSGVPFLKYNASTGYPDFYSTN